MIPVEMRAPLKKLIVSHEEDREFPYDDGFGNITIGIGYNLTARGLPQSWRNEQYERDVEYFYSQFCQDYFWFPELSQARQIALIDMAFMGYKKIQEFKKMLTALENHDYDLAADEMLNSEWATEVKGRAIQLAEIMRKGIL